MLAAVALVAAEAPARADAQPAASTQTFENGATLSYGVTLSLLQFSAARSANEPGRLRNYTPSLEVLPAEIGFQFIFNPQNAPWRLNKKDDSRFQLMSIGGAILARIRNEGLVQGNLSLAIELGFFENSLSIGLGVDLYRGIPILSGSGVAGGGTAYTGLLAAAFVKEGELTPENVFLLVSFSLSGVVNALSGKVQ
jgi:hypothetical protein